MHSAIYAASIRLGTHAALTEDIAQLSHICGERASSRHLIWGASASHFEVRVIGKLKYSSLYVDAIEMPRCNYLLAGS